MKEILAVKGVSQLLGQLGDSSDTGGEVNELIAVTHQAVMIPPMLEGGLTLAVLPSYGLEQLAQTQSDDPVLHEQSAAEECPMKTADPSVGLDILPVAGPSLSEVMEPGESGLYLLVVQGRTLWLCFVDRTGSTKVNTRTLHICPSLDSGL